MWGVDCQYTPLPASNGVIRIKIQVIFKQIAIIWPSLTPRGGGLKIILFMCYVGFKMTFIGVKRGWNDFLFEDPGSTHQDRHLDTHHCFWGWFFISVICQLTDLTAENKGENQIIHVACGVSIVNIPPYWHQMLPSESRFKPYLSKKKKYSDPMSQHL